MLGVLYVANSSYVLCGAVSVPAPPLELQEIILAGAETTIPPALELEKVTFQPEEIDAKTENQSARFEDEDLNKVLVSSQCETEESESEAASSVTQEIKIDASQDSLEAETNELREDDTNPSGPVDIPALSPLDTPAAVPVTTPSTTQAPPQPLSARERQSLIGQ